MNSHNVKDNILIFTLNKLTFDVYEEMNSLLEANEPRGLIVVIPDRYELLSPEFWTLANLPHIIWNEVAYAFNPMLPQTIVIAIDDELLPKIHSLIPRYIFDILDVNVRFIRIEQVDRAIDFFDYIELNLREI